MDKEEVVHIYNGMLAISSNMDEPRDCQLNEVSQRKTNIIWYCLYVKLKKATNELIYKTEIVNRCTK